MRSFPAYVLSTRSLSPSLVKEAAAKGVIIDTLPFIAVDPLTSGEGGLPAGPLTAVFTSANAVAALEKGGSRDWKIFCLSGATQRQATERFGQGAIVGTAASASELARVIVRHMNASTGKEVWFFCGDKRRDELPDLLQQAGFAVHEIVVYHTRRTPHRIARVYDAIAFFSPSAVESFFSVNTLPPDIPLYAIGGTTAGAIRRRCGNPVMESESPDQEVLIRQIIKNTQH